MISKFCDWSLHALKGDFLERLMTSGKFGSEGLGSPAAARIMGKIRETRKQLTALPI